MYELATKKKFECKLSLCIGQYKIWATDFGLSMKFVLGIKRWLENMDWV